jgi:FMN-dependent NADH-azoreductase
MTNILVINSSAAGEASVSSSLINSFVEAARHARPEATVVLRDVGTDPLPHLTPATLGGLRGEPQTEAERRTRAISDALIGELRAADLIVIGAPMYNFGITSTLKAWFDHVLRAGETFRYTAEGPEGLLKGKRAIVVETRGGLYSEGPAASLDSQEPHLRTLLGFAGITDVTFVRAERLALGPDAGAASINAANDALRAFAAAA